PFSIQERPYHTPVDASLILPFQRAQRRPGTVTDVSGGARRGGRESRKLVDGGVGEEEDGLRQVFVDGAVAREPAELVLLGPQGGRKLEMPGALEDRAGRMSADRREQI